MTDLKLCKINGVDQTKPSQCRWCDADFISQSESDRFCSNRCYREKYGLTVDPRDTSDYIDDEMGG